MPFPAQRPRRLRATEPLRRLVRETEVAAHHLIAPLFVKDGIRRPEPIDSMPGHVQHTLESLAAEAEELIARGIGGLLLFGVPAAKDAHGSQAWAADGIVQRALSALRQALGDEAVLIADLCLCEYTDHGHCGVLSQGTVQNDATLELYAKVARAQANAGADIVAPSGMMDGQVARIRTELDEAGFGAVAIMAYAAKYASALYGPFRQAAECAPRSGDRSGYQMDAANRREALRESLLDELEGADILMVKPAGMYLDVISDLRRETNLPVAAYQVSGEYSMIKAAGANGWLNEARVASESVTAIRRAGAGLVVTYFAKELA